MALIAQIIHQVFAPNGAAHISQRGVKLVRAVIYPCLQILATGLRKGYPLKMPLLHTHYFPTDGVKNLLARSKSSSRTISSSDWRLYSITHHLSRRSFSHLLASIRKRCRRPALHRPCARSSDQAARPCPTSWPERNPEPSTRRTGAPRQARQTLNRNLRHRCLWCMTGSFARRQSSPFFRGSLCPRPMAWHER